MLELNQVYNMDCMEGMREIPDSTVDLVPTDPPYYKVKPDEWDHQWPSAEAYLEWLDQIVAECTRVLKPNGSLYLFASPQMAAHVEVLISKHMNVLNHIVWNKPASRASQAEKEALRAYFPDSERIIFAEQYGADKSAKGEDGYERKCEELRGFVFEPLRAYLEGERKKSDTDKSDCNVACGFSRTSGGMAARHYFGKSQWCMPTHEHYLSLCKLFNRDHIENPEYLTREYEELREEYEKLLKQYMEQREEYDKLRRSFNADPRRPFTDVWHYASVAAYEGKHPCEKPRAMIDHIIRTSSKPGDLIVDPFGGSGITAEVCIDTERQYILFENDKKNGYFRTMQERIHYFTRQLPLEGI